MKRLLALMVAVMLCSGCSALPGEDRSFAVALGVSFSGDVWEVCARVPTYQTGGGYLTLSALGSSIGEAMALLNASAPMELHYGQVRMLVFSRVLAESGQLPELLQSLSARGEVRAQAALCITESSVKDVMDALEPATGSRLSKALEAMLQTRQKMGVLPCIALSDWLLMGSRQQPVLMNIALEPTAGNATLGMDAPAGRQATEGSGKVQLSGGWLMGQDGRAQGSLSAMEMQLLTLLQNQWRQGTLSLPDGTITLLDAKTKINAQERDIYCYLSLDYSASSYTEEGVRQALLDQLKTLMGKLQKANCDALSIARKLMVQCMNTTEWNELEWTKIYPSATWHFTVHARREA